MGQQGVLSLNGGTMESNIMIEMRGITKHFGSVVANENVDLTVALLKEYGCFEDCWFYAFNGRIIRYLKEKYNGRTMGYPDFQMQEFESDSYEYYDEIGISMSIMRSEVLPIYKAKNLPMHFYCANDERTVRECIAHGAALITADNPVPLMKVLGRK